MSEGPPIPADADTVIVGGGFSGLAIADEMARRGAAKVLVVEAGPDAGKLHYRTEFDGDTATAMWLDPERDRYAWRPYQGSGRTFTGISALRRRLGGRSLYWHGIVLPIEPWALNSGQWPCAIVRDLTVEWDGGPPLYTRITQQLGEWAAPASALSSGRTVDIAGYRLAEAPYAVRRNPDNARWRAYSPLERWSGGAELRCEARVEEILMTGGRASGVRVEHGGRRYSIMARNVVLAASTIENSRLAIQLLTAIGRLREARLTGLVDKVSQGFVATFPPDRLPDELREAATKYRVYVGGADLKLRSNLFLNFSVNPRGVAVVDAYLLGEQTSSAYGSVWCEPGAQAPWPTKVACSLCPEDAELVKAQKAELQRIYAWLCSVTGGGQPTQHLVFADDEEFGSADLPDLLCRAEALARPQQPYTYAFPLGAELHEASTLPLGKILGDDLQFIDVPGLYACGPSVFPRTGAANPVLTTLALAVRLGSALSAHG